MRSKLHYGRLLWGRHTALTVEAISPIGLGLLADCLPSMIPIVYPTWLNVLEQRCAGPQTPSARVVAHGPPWHGLPLGGVIFLFLERS